MTTPKNILDSLPDIKEDTQRHWTHLAIRFVTETNGLQPFDGDQGNEVHILI